MFVIAQKYDCRLLLRMALKKEGRLMCFDIKRLSLRDVFIKKNGKLLLKPLFFAFLKKSRIFAKRLENDKLNILS